MWLFQLHPGESPGVASVEGQPRTASWNIAWMRGLAALRAARFAGAAVSRALLYPLPDWLALSVACVMLSSVRPGKSRSRDRCPTSS